MDTKLQIINASTSNRANVKESQGSPPKLMLKLKLVCSKLGLKIWNLGLGILLIKKFGCVSEVNQF